MEKQISNAMCAWALILTRSIEEDGGSERICGRRKKYERRVIDDA